MHGIGYVTKYAFRLIYGTQKEGLLDNHDCNYICFQVEFSFLIL